jgi:hypothetical protein
VLVPPVLVTPGDDARRGSGLRLEPADSSVSRDLHRHQSVRSRLEIPVPGIVVEGHEIEVLIRPSCNAGREGIANGRS